MLIVICWFSLIIYHNESTNIKTLLYSLWNIILLWTVLVFKFFPIMNQIFFFSIFYQRNKFIPSYFLKKLDCQLDFFFPILPVPYNLAMATLIWHFQSDSSVWVCGISFMRYSRWKYVVFDFKRTPSQRSSQKSYPRFVLKNLNFVLSAFSMDLDSLKLLKFSFYWHRISKLFIFKLIFDHMLKNMLPFLYDNNCSSYCFFRLYSKL